MPLPILALALSAFAIGTTEFVIMGILPDVAQSLSVSIPSAGLLVSGYALGVAVGAPLLAVLTSRMPRKWALLLLMGIFIVGNILCAVAPGYTSLMIARVVTSFAHGSFFGIGSVVAASLVPQDKRASAVALMFTGLALANVLGVPLGTFIGQMLGWRAAFWSVAGAGVLAALALVALVPNTHEAQSASLAHEVGVLKHPQVWLALLMTVLGFGGMFVVFTYITPVLEQASGFAPSGVTKILVLFGIGLAIGNALGGKLADRGVMRTLTGVFVVLVAIMVMFSRTMHHPVASVLTIFVWGVAAFATVPGLQMRVLSKAASAPNLASTLNIGAFNVGNAMGAWLGGMALSHGHALDTLPLVAAAVTLLAIAVTAFASRLDRRETAQANHPARFPA
ncbi:MULTISPECIES: MFS transporter [unclassified Burkholderia]|uniref:MFS transporter n=1 Tax=unclassified Burkholderia TaxID=2613784 RepID=UPI00142292CB|nr:MULTISPECIES: MFS transporter [unclassified Burkholderia]NIE56212.1 MFS transporter [Burkholderia sp. Ap-955]NIF08817.1 MFS transporter [Burkholderia sp. Ax-1735]NIG05900.1 MFS transporter [Burkholderia sp. Tr-849]